MKLVEKTGSSTVKQSDHRQSIPTIFRPDSPTNELDLDQESSGDEYDDQRCLDYGENPIFLGKSSELKLVQLAIEARTGGKETSYKWVKKSDTRRPEFWDVQPVRFFLQVGLSVANVCQVDEIAEGNTRNCLRFS